MIQDFADFCLWTYVVVDDIFKQIAPLLSRRGPTPDCSDSELISMTLIGEARGWAVETELLSHFNEHRDLFPQIPSQSRFNRRRRNLMSILNRIRQILLSGLDLSADPQCVIDSLPLPVVKFHLVPSSPKNWSAYGADFGHVASKKQTIYGYKLHLLVTMGGVIVDFELAPASASDLEVGFELLWGHTDKTVIGDKAYISAELAAQLWEQKRVKLQTIPRRNQKRQLPPRVKQIINSVRQIIETVNNQLNEQFAIETNHAHTFWGLCTRLYSKLTAHTLCIYLNRSIGKADFLQIKSLAFPC